MPTFYVFLLTNIPSRKITLFSFNRACQACQLGWKKTSELLQDKFYKAVKGAMRINVNCLV